VTDDMDDTSPPIHDPPSAPPARGRYRVPLGLPAHDEGRRAGAVVSIVIHALIIGLLIVPFFMPTSVIERMQQGAGGAGPAGGGGGGSRGSGGGMVETLHFVKVFTHPVPTPTSIPSISTPVIPPAPKVQPPKPVAAPAETPPEQVMKPAAPSSTQSVVAGTGGGSGTDGSAGAGPGSGGGIGAGIGTGKGGASGPGTGGGTQTNYPPATTALYLLPIPAPASVRGFTVVANFDVDSTGRVLDFKFTETPDGSYNRRVASILRTMRFRPGTRPDGTPVRMMAQLIFGPL
jgi:protein TonB